MSVETIMTRSILSIGPTATVREAVQLIEDSDIRHLPVVEGKKLIGILSDRDLREYRLPLMVEIERFDEPGQQQVAADLLKTPVSEVMNTDIVGVDSSESIDSLIGAMIEYKVGAVPVIDRHTEELVGIVSYIDVLRHARTLLNANE